MSTPPFCLISIHFSHKLLLIIGMGIGYAYFIQPTELDIGKNLEKTMCAWDRPPRHLIDHKKQWNIRPKYFEM